MNKELEEAINRLKAIKDAKLDSDSEIALFEFAENDKYIDLILNYIENSISKEVIGKYLQDIQGKYIKNIAKVEKEELLNISMPVFRGIQLEGQRKILKELLEEK